MGRKDVCTRCGTVTGTLIESGPARLLCRCESCGAMKDEHFYDDGSECEPDWTEVAELEAE